ncbi:hypothetical protein HanRHA438_Chr01g0028601 [Helianthus annuus]|nr:hypothetical protein HanRHA438_Chr01g0028601 [Helianthus annuus]
MNRTSFFSQHHVNIVIWSSGSATRVVVSAMERAPPCSATAVEVRVPPLKVSLSPFTLSYESDMVMINKPSFDYVYVGWLCRRGSATRVVVSGCLLE